MRNRDVKTPMKLDEARNLISEKGIEVAQNLFAVSLDQNLEQAMFEELDRQADVFNKHQREVMVGLPMNLVKSPFP